MIELSKLAKQLKQSDSVAVFCHVRPDGDAVGSMIALTLGLKTLGVRADAYCKDEIPKKFEYIKGVSEVKEVIDKEYSALVAVDCADIARLGEFSALFANKKATTFNIDHHVSNTRFAKTNYVEDKPANCENVYNLLKEMGVEFNKDIATALATGIMTDTGNFNHKGVPSSTLKVASYLVDEGADLNDISYRMFTAQSKNRASLFGKVMSNITYLLDGAFAFAFISQKDLLDTGAKKDETEGFVDFIMGIDCVKVGATVMEMDKNTYKISLRSKGADVNRVALTFGGGGHKLASGCQIQGEYYDVIDKLRYAVSQYIDD